MAVAKETRNPLLYLPARLRVWRLIPRVWIVVAVIQMVVGSAFAQANDRFVYDPHKAARDQVRNQIADSVYRCARAFAFGDISHGVRQRSDIHRDPRVISCFNLLRDSKWFSREEKRDIFNRIVDRAINDVINTGQP